MSAIMERSKVRALDLRPVVKDTGEFVAKASRVLGVTRRSAERWLINGVNEKRADEIAVKVFGLHPMDLWGEDWATLADHYAELANVAADRAARKAAA